MSSSLLRLARRAAASAPASTLLAPTMFAPARSSVQPTLGRPWLQKSSRVVNVMGFSSGTGKPRKPGVASDEEMEAFFAANSSEEIVVIDARNTNFELEPDDARWDDASGAPMAACGTALRPRACNAPYDRAAKSMDLEGLEPLLTKGKDTPIITHCGGGGRGQKAKEYLIAEGFTNVLNGGGAERKGELGEIRGDLITMAQCAGVAP
eukprot:CAMPEP_0182580222 /NCGR_PEP_ID=MMETSP1324-20130603/46354_1 /TAXON_ID=236786 /ORGANISM="Florenciella sp., Strain RCC1587" /LENGTH=207 /DNA_ID=CAMNT_0024796419 /DNA_START=9 /DNA_END=627 /DNA_ORIENTATION=-